MNLKSGNIIRNKFDDLFLIISDPIVIRTLHQAKAVRIYDDYQHECNSAIHVMTPKDCGASGVICLNGEETIYENEAERVGKINKHLLHYVQAQM